MEFVLDETCMDFLHHCVLIAELREFSEFTVENTMRLVFKGIK